MAVVATTTYLYADTSLTQYFIQGAELVDTGAWSSATSYAVLNVVQIGDTQYIAIAQIHALVEDYPKIDC